jgi:hypothetical protein
LLKGVRPAAAAGRVEQGDVASNHKARWRLRGGIVLSSGREVGVDVTLDCPPDLDAEDAEELRGFQLALHDLTPVREPAAD